jgi:serine/threonine-protein kinase
MWSGCVAAEPVPAGGGSLYEPFTISPDGQWLVYTVIRDGKTQLLLRSIQEFEGKLIAGTEGGSVPFFSPDSQWIGFGAGKELKKVAVSGGSPVVICTCLNAFLVGDWGADNRILFVPDFNLGIWTVPAGGGTASQLLKTDETKDRIAYTYVQLLPENKGILLSFASGQTINADDEKIAILEPGAAEPRIIVQGGSNPRYLPTGNLVYVRGGSLLSVGFDLARLALTGTPVTLIDGIERNVTGDSEYAVSQNGTLVYEPAAGIQAGGRFVMVDRKGSVRPITERRGAPSDFSLSHDGKYIAARLIAINDDIWTYDVATGTPTRLTFEPFDELFPQWTPDGTRIAFSTRTGKIYWKPADGSAPREELSAGEYPRQTGSFSPDGKTLAFVESHPTRRGDIWLMSLDDRKAQPFLATDANESAPRFSPDGHSLAYVSDETGRNEIYIRPIGSVGGRKRVSTEGGNWPAWARNGKELFFLRDDKLASVTLDAQANAIGRDRILLDAPALDDLIFTGNGPMYDVMPDGEHFVMVLRPRNAAASHYNLIVNWFEELRRKTSRQQPSG